MIDIIQAPKKSNTYTTNKLFLAGGISNCPDWQKEFCKKLNQYNGDLIVYNPRRVGDLAKNGSDAEYQIKWEHQYLAYATHMIFWFPEESVCPITLFELGKYCELFKNEDAANQIIVGIHPNYSRKFDLEIQLPLISDEIKIVYSLDDLFDETTKMLNLERITNES